MAVRPHLTGFKRSKWIITRLYFLSFIHTEVELANQWAKIWLNPEWNMAGGQLFLQPLLFRSSNYIVKNDCLLLRRHWICDESCSKSFQRKYTWCEDQSLMLLSVFLTLTIQFPLKNWSQTVRKRHLSKSYDGKTDSFGEKKSVFGLPRSTKHENTHWIRRRSLVSLNFTIQKRWRVVSITEHLW